MKKAILVTLAVALTLYLSLCFWPDISKIIHYDPELKNFEEKISWTTSLEKDLKPLDIKEAEFEERNVEGKTIYNITIAYDEHAETYFYPTRKLYEKMKKNPDDLKLYGLECRIKNDNKVSLSVNDEIYPKQEGEILIDCIANQGPECAEFRANCDHSFTAYCFLTCDKTEEDIKELIKSVDLGIKCSPEEIEDCDLMLVVK